MVVFVVAGGAADGSADGTADATAGALLSAGAAEGGVVGDDDDVESPVGVAGAALLLLHALSGARKTSRSAIDLFIGPVPFRPQGVSQLPRSKLNARRA